MAITRERQPYHPGRKAHWGGDPCAGGRTGDWLRNFYREYAPGSGIKRQLSRRGFPGELVRQIESWLPALS